MIDRVVFAFVSVLLSFVGVMVILLALEVLAINVLATDPDKFNALSRVALISVTPLGAAFISPFLVGKN